jgi:hypothetical protein
LLRRADALEVLACAAEALPDAARHAAAAARAAHARALQAAASSGASAGALTSASAAAAQDAVAEAAAAASPEGSGHCLALALSDVNAALALDPTGRLSLLGNGAAWLQRSRLLRHMSHGWGAAAPARGAAGADVAMLADAVASARHAHSLSVTAFAAGLDPARTAAGGGDGDDAEAASAAATAAAAAAVAVGRAVADLKRELKLAEEAQAVEALDAEAGRRNSTHALATRRHRSAGGSFAPPPHAALPAGSSAGSSAGLVSGATQGGGEAAGEDSEAGVAASDTKRSRRALAGDAESAPAAAASSEPPPDDASSEASSLSRAMGHMARDHAERLAEMERAHAQEV